MGAVTGIVDEFLSLKADTEADLLAMQVGDFYEFFDEDAETVADELDLQVSTKSSHGSSYPMAGVPVSELTPYLKALVERGYRVAVADQHETDDGHEREVTRVVTPGTLLETTDASAQYLAAVVRDDESAWGLAFVDVTTGRFHVTQVAASADAYTELYRFDPVEVLPGPSVRDEDEAVATLRSRTDATVTPHEANAFAPGAATHRLKEQFGEEALHSLGIEPGSPAVRAAGAALDYVAETGLGVARSVTRLQPYRADDHVELDATTQRNLELTETMQGDRSGSLFATLDHTVTSAGGRLLREWLQRPRRSVEEIESRQEAVAAFTQAALARDAISDTLSNTYDLERLASKIAHGSADAHDLLAVRDTLEAIPTLADAVESTPGLADSPVADIVNRADRETLGEVREELADAIVADPPKTLTQGGLFQRGYDDDLDDLIAGYEEAMEWIEALEPGEKSRLGVTHLQVDRNKTDGYYIQIGKSEAEKAPEEYREIKTLKNSKRFTTDELDERERRILRIEDERADLEYDLFEEFRDRLADVADVLQAAGRTLAELDALASLGLHAVENDWTRPTVTGGDGLDVEAGRHPVVEQTTEFVPNDARFESGRRFLIVTGPNMSGKSTFLRQTALIVLLAQIGSYVPARSARIGTVDGIFTRVGALDELAQGRSTFMVEMQELSNILHSASEDSLVILDEVGRGTATYDGISIAWAATEYLHNEVRAKTLFATHYHELTRLADHLDDVANVHIAADERDGDVTFLRTVREGPTDRSYGIHVADLAGVPDPVVDRASNVLDTLRADNAIEAKGSGRTEPVQAVFDLGSGEFTANGAGDDRGADSDRDPDREADSDRDPDRGADSDREANPDPDREAIVEDLADLPLNELTPIEVLSRVQDMQERLQ
ncbi:DNA mismatch repair protein MutS [Halanaeroarchaeum sulfurireducens]|uniref:DNA mismatch repair protein MutS n=1 Tax=Halanaeroarchaeum sulfurireducens TaxID=1604004 RepID=UPI0006799077|nr:DNA mismatch repair protein MutS [Halanaeroarchaeum sulfurireducens]